MDESNSDAAIAALRAEITRLERDTDQLRKDSEALWVEREKRLDERWQAQEATATREAASLEARLVLLNELRSGILTRVEYNSRHETLIATVDRVREEVRKVEGEYLTLAQHAGFVERISSLEIWRANLMGRAVALGILGAISIAAIAAIFTHIAVK